MKNAADGRKTRCDGTLCSLLAQLHEERVYLMSLVAQTYRHLSDNLERELKQAVGIPPVFFDVLVHVAAAPAGRQTMSRLSDEIGLSTGGTTRLVDRMVGAGLVLRENSLKDRRSIHVVLTATGREALERSVATHVESIDRYLVAPLSDDDRASLAVTLSKVLGQEPSHDDVQLVR